MDEINLELGSDQTIESGEAIILNPDYTSLSPIRSFQWQTNNPEPIDCPTCRSTMVQPLSDTEVFLMIENRTGCQTRDDLLLKVEGVKVFAPNIFSPNNDNQNDFFFLQGNLPFDVSQFQIYDRWGNLHYQKNNLKANQVQSAWDGTQNGQPSISGVYIWKAVINYKNGQREVLSGDVTLIR